MYFCKFPRRLSYMGRFGNSWSNTIYFYRWINRGLRRRSNLVIVYNFLLRNWSQNYTWLFSSYLQLQHYVLCVNGHLHWSSSMQKIYVREFRKAAQYPRVNPRADCELSPESHLNTSVFFFYCCSLRNLCC